MEDFLNTLTNMATHAGGKILLALLVLIIGNIVIKSLVKRLKKGKLFAKVEDTVRSFSINLIKGLLYVLLVIAIIGIFGVPMASVITVLASAGVAVGLALQGALSNLAGGIMLMIFKPFHIGDYVEAGGAEGTVKDINLFYTVFITLDNKRIMVPNGTLMNANVVDYSSEELRRVDLTFACAKSEEPAKIQKIILEVLEADPRGAKTQAPFARVSGGTNESMEFAARLWCKSSDYWDVYFDLTQKIIEALAANGVQAPAIRIVGDK